METPNQWKTYNRHEQFTFTDATAGVQQPLIPNLRSFCPRGFEREILGGGQRVWRYYRQARKITHGWRHILWHRAERTSVNAGSGKHSWLIDTVPFLHRCHIGVAFWSRSFFVRSRPTSVTSPSFCQQILQGNCLKYGQFRPFPKNLGDTFWKSV